MRKRNFNRISEGRRRVGAPCLRGDRLSLCDGLDSIRKSGVIGWKLTLHLEKIAQLDFPLPQPLTLVLHHYDTKKICN